MISLPYTWMSTPYFLPTSPLGQPARSSLDECLSVRTVLCVLIQEHCGAALCLCLEPGIALIALNAQHRSVLPAVFAALLSLTFLAYFFVSICSIQALLSKQKRVLFTGCLSIGRMLDLPSINGTKCKRLQAVSFSKTNNFLYIEPLWWRNKNSGWVKDKAKNSSPSDYGYIIFCNIVCRPVGKTRKRRGSWHSQINGIVLLASAFDNTTWQTIICWFVFPLLV